MSSLSGDNKFSNKARIPRPASAQSDVRRNIGQGGGQHSQRTVTISLNNHRSTINRPANSSAALIVAGGYTASSAAVASVLPTAVVTATEIQMNPSQPIDIPTQQPTPAYSLPQSHPTPTTNEAPIYVNRGTNQKNGPRLKNVCRVSPTATDGSSNDGSDSTSESQTPAQQNTEDSGSPYLAQTNVMNDDVSSSMQNTQRRHRPNVNPNRQQYFNNRSYPTNRGGRSYNNTYRPMNQRGTRGGGRGGSNRGSNYHSHPRYERNSDYRNRGGNNSNNGNHNHNNGGNGNNNGQYRERDRDRDLPRSTYRPRGGPRRGGFRPDASPSTPDSVRSNNGRGYNTHNINSNSPSQQPRNNRRYNNINNNNNNGNNGRYRNGPSSGNSNTGSESRSNSNSTEMTPSNHHRTRPRERSFTNQSHRGGYRGGGGGVGSRAPRGDSRITSSGGDRDANKSWRRERRDNVDRPSSVPLFSDSGSSQSMYDMANADVLTQFFSQFSGIPVPHTTTPVPNPYPMPSATSAAAVAVAAATMQNVNLTPMTPPIIRRNSLSNKHTPTTIQPSQLDFSVNNLPDPSVTAANIQQLISTAHALAGTEHTQATNLMDPSAMTPLNLPNWNQPSMFQQLGGMAMPPMLTMDNSNGQSQSFYPLQSMVQTMNPQFSNDAYNAQFYNQTMPNIGSMSIAPSSPTLQQQQSSLSGNNHTTDNSDNANWQTNVNQSN